MRILLIGEYSNMHATLAESLRRLGHEVVVVSDGDHWRNYKRDIDITRKDASSKIDGIRLVMKLIGLLPKMRGFDVVQIINPKFLPLKAHFSRWMLRYLRKHNRIVSMGCFGMDSIVLRRQNEGCLEYSDSFCYGKLINEENVMERAGSWLMPDEIKTTEEAAKTADCLIACLYEYYANYDLPEYKSKLHYIGEPITIFDQAEPRKNQRLKKDIKFPVNVLVGIQPKRIVEKGIDQILPLLERLASEHPDKIKINKVECVPFDQYQKLLAETDVLVDQLYSYTPAMNALEAMKVGTVVVSGGEEDYYDFIGEKELRPIINLRPFDDENNYNILKNALLDFERLRRLSAQSIDFVKKYHDSDSIARQYIEVFDALSRF